MNIAAFGIRNVDFRYDLDAGTFSVNLHDFCKIKNAWSFFTDESQKTFSSREMKLRKIVEDQTSQDSACRMITVECKGEDTTSLRQRFKLYGDGCLTVCIEAANAARAVTTNHMVPVCARGEENFALYGQNLKALFAPFDNDKWARFASYPLEYAPESHEFTAVYDENELCGLVAGSVTHDTWKTGICVKGVGNRLTQLEIYAGAAGEQTRDTLPHGAVSGNCVRSSEIFIGWFASYRRGLELFGDFNAREMPPLPWSGPVPFGWNSWAALMETLTDEKYIEASDFFYHHVQPNAPESRVYYINFDAFWQCIPEEKLKAAIAHVRQNGQKPGAYLTPFMARPDNMDTQAEDAGGYTWRELLLKDPLGNILPPVDGHYSLDPTHPGTLARMEKSAESVISLGFTYIKTDFVGHAAREGCFCESSVTTGMQAYRYGMSRFCEMLSREKAGRDIFISLSIAPVLPGGYGHARRISCDSFGTIDQSEYMLNSLTYLWWMNNRLYRFNDPDHIVLYKTYDKDSSTENEARTRLNAAAICGTVMLNSDDFSYAGARERAEKLLNNEEINRLAAAGETFEPLSGNTDEKAADAFIRKTKDEVYLAVFNYSPCKDRMFRFSAHELGLVENAAYGARDLWSKEETRFIAALPVTLPPAGSTVFRITKQA